MPRISAVTSVAKNRGLGKNNKLLWRFPKDLKRFQALTMGHPVIMGRKTYESIGRTLPGRTNIIVTRDHKYEVPGAIIVHSIDDGFEAAAEVEAEEIFVIGGAEIFKQAWPKITRLYLTEVDDAPEADAFLPDYSDFSVILEEEPVEENGLTYIYRVRERPRE